MSQDRTANLFSHLFAAEEVGKDLRQGSSVTFNYFAQISENVKLLAMAIKVSLASEEQVFLGGFSLLYADRDRADGGQGRVARFWHEFEVAINELARLSGNAR